MNLPSITIGYINHHKGGNNHLQPSLDNLPSVKEQKSRYGKEIKINQLPNTSFPSKVYNELLYSLKKEVVILTHQDISFSPNLLDEIYSTISALEKQVGEWGVLGITGVRVENNKPNQVWGRNDKIFDVLTCDGCFMVINTKHKVYFDEDTFNDFHLYCEDYCMQMIKEKGIKTYTLALNSFEEKPATTYYDLQKTEENGFISHHSLTLNKKGENWGKYNEYKQKYIDKWK